MRRWEEEIIRPYNPRQNNLCAHSDQDIYPLGTIDAIYHFTGAPKGGAHKRLFDFLFSNGKLDIYDQALKDIHDRFVREQRESITWASHDIEARFLGEFSCQADLKPTNLGGNPELLFMFWLPLFPDDFFARVCKETSIIDVPANLIDEAMQDAKQEADNFYHRS